MSALLDYISSFFSPNKPKSLKGLHGVKKMETILNNLILEERVPGLAVTLIKEGKTVLQKGYGFEDLERKERIEPQQSIFRIASISKCITGLALGKMVEEEILGFEDSFFKHVPYYPKKEYDFTLRQLANHTAGIRAYRGKEFGLDKAYTIKESIEIFKDDPLVFEPGKGYLYNSFGSVLLSLAMQEASGVPFEEYVKKKVLEPIGMLNTFPPKNNNNVVKEYSTKFYSKKGGKGFKNAIQVNNFYKLAGGGYLSTSEDVAKLGQSILEQKILKPETYQELLTSHEINGQPTYYGLGFQVSQDKKGREYVGHVGSSVGAYSNLFVYPKEGVIASILINCTDPQVQQELDIVINEAFGAVF